MIHNQPFFKSLPYRNIILNITEPPYPQKNHNDWSINNRTMNDYDLFICQKGEALFTLKGKEFKLREGTALLVPPHCLVSAHKLSRYPVEMVAQHFMLYLFHKTDFFSHIRYRPFISFKNWPLINTLLIEISSIINRSRGSWNQFDTNPLFMVILNAFIQESYDADEYLEERKSSMVLEIIARIESEYKNPLIMDKIMAQSGFSYSHTSNIFRDYTGLSIKSYIIERRLEAAKELLLQGGRVKECAEAAGYDDEFYFSRIFKKYTGATPRDFSKRI